MTTRALVLGGGGVTGIAWETGLLNGLAQAGIHLADADLIIGTSAGSVVGAQIAAGRQPAELLAAQRAPSDGEIEGSMGQDLQTLITAFGLWAAQPTMTAAVAREIGKMALAAKTVDETRWLAAFDGLLGATDWPTKALKLIAVDAETGERRVWEQSSGVPLRSAVASSCAVPGLFPPVTINGRRYMDGGVASNTSTDLALGHDLALVISPLGASEDGIGGVIRRTLDAEVESLRAAGVRVLVALPDAAALTAIGPNAMDPSRRAAVAQAGLDQAASLAAEARALWSGAGVPNAV